MKDYTLIRYLAKLTGAKLTRGKNEICCNFPYSDKGIDVIPTHIIFEHRQSILEFFDLTQVYELYGKKDYATYPDFVNEFVEVNDYFTTMDFNGVLCVKSDLTVNKLEHTASPALVNYSLVMIALNKMLGRKETVISEDEWRSYHRDMLKKLTSQSKLFSYIGAGSFVGGVLVAIFLAESSGFLTTLAVLLILGGIICAPFFFLRGKFYDRLYKKALKEKNY